MINALAYALNTTVVPSSKKQLIAFIDDPMLISFTFFMHVGV